MVAKKPVTVSREIAIRAHKVLAFAKQRAVEVQYQHELSNAIYSPDGMAMKLFPTEEERRAFLKTTEHKEIRKLLAELPYPAPSETIVIRIPSSANGKSKRRRKSK